ncbi:MAG TPA: radical SAM protein [Chthoniobacterales bacterium]
MPKFFIKTYGCQMNERDSEQVAHSLVARGYERVSCETEADVVLLNTCSVRDMAEQKALGKMGMLGRMAKGRPETVFGFLGCMAQARGAELLKQIPHLDLVVGTQKFHRVGDYIDDLVARKRATLAAVVERSLNRMEDLRFSIVDVEEEIGSQSTIRDQSLAPKQATAFVSIMQGCNMHCTFCIVPRTRGVERSRTIAEIVSEVRALVADGIKEVTLLGQIVNLYGRHEFPAVGSARVPRAVSDILSDPPREAPQNAEASAQNVRATRKSPFVQLLEAVSAIDGLERLRFTSPHPIGFRDDLIDAMSRLPKLAEHVHLPLQSGSNRILKAMHRIYTAEKYAQLVGKIRAARPGIAITTDIIVGFPGETESDYKATRDLVERLQFDNGFIFRYSPRRETPAATMLDQIDESVKEARNQDLLGIINASARCANERLVGTHVEVLCEGPSKTNPARLMGRTRTNKVVVFEAEENRIGKIFDVAIERANGFSLYGQPID